MPEATNAQMQVYADSRIRPRAEQFLLLLNAVLADKAAIDDVYARASGSNAWADARLDGPPHLLQAGNGANPDDFLNYNAFATAFVTFMQTTQASAWGVLQRAVVRSL